MIKMNKK